jgi:putative peptidoglycan lipid II flippase
LKRTLLVSLCESLNVVVQFANFMLWGYFFGAQAEMDAFLTSLALPMVMVTAISGPLVSSLVPLLVEVRRQDAAAELPRFKGNLLNLFAAGGLLAALLLVFASRPLIGLIAPGLPPARRLLAAHLLRIESLAIPFSVVGGVLIGFHYAEEKFYRPTVAPFFGGLAAMLTLVLWHERLGIRALAWGMVLSALVQVLFMLGIVRSHRWRLDWKDDGVRKLLRRMLPLSFGNMYYKSDSLVDRFLLSFLPVGSISYLGYGQRLLQVIGQVLGRGLVTTRFTGLSAQNLGDRSAFKENVNRQFALVGFVIAPVAVCLALFSEPALRFALQRGAFSALDVQRTTTVVIAFLGVLVGGLLGSVLANAFYALGDTRTITLIGISVFSAGMLLKLAGVLAFSYLGVALGASLYYLLAVVVEMAVLQKKISIFSWRLTGRMLLKVTAAAAGALAAGGIFRSRMAKGLVAECVGIVLVLAVYLLLSWRLGTIPKRIPREN